MLLEAKVVGFVGASAKSELNFEHRGPNPSPGSDGQESDPSLERREVHVLDEDAPNRKGGPDVTKRAMDE